MEASNIEIQETVSASKKLSAVDAKLMLKQADTVIAMKGKKVNVFDVTKKAGADAVNSMLGPTGNMRAPTIRIGRTLLVGFNAEIYAEHFAQ